MSAGTNPLSLSASDIDASQWISTSQEALQETISKKQSVESIRSAGASGSGMDEISPNNFAWPVGRGTL